MAFISTTVRPAISERIQSALADLREHRTRRALYRRTVNELEVLSDRDLADLGISRFSISDLARKHAFGA